MLDKNQHDQESGEVPTFSDGVETALRNFLLNVMALVCCIILNLVGVFGTHKDLDVDFTREVKGCTIQEDGDLAECLDAGHPRANAISDLSPKSSKVL